MRSISNLIISLGCLAIIVGCDLAPTVDAGYKVEHIDAKSKEDCIYKLEPIKGFGRVWLRSDYGKYSVGDTLFFIKRASGNHE